MTEVRFYHMLQKKLDQALPEILSKALERDYRVVVKAADEEVLTSIDENLWCYKPVSFLPHSMERDGNESEHPIWLTQEDGIPNQANMLVLVDGVESDLVDNVELCCELFDGNREDIVNQARERWKTYKEKGYDISYFQQDVAGRWQKK